MIVNLQYDSAALSAPQSFRDGMQAAANLIDAAFADDITLNIVVGYGEFPAFNGQASNALPNQNTSRGDFWGGQLSYSVLRQDLINSATSADDLTSINTLTAGSSIEGQSSFLVSDAQLKLFGLSSFGIFDGAVGMGTTFTGGNLIAAALHELTHAMGRAVAVGSAASLDLFRFNENGSKNRVFGGTIPAVPAYFSIDGGVTKLADFGINSDPSDFLTSGVQGSNDPFNETVGNLTTFTEVDLRIMDVLGFHRFFVLNGDDNPNLLNGTSANELINGLGGNDSISGGAAADRIYGNIGNDLIYGNQGDDTVFGGQDADTIFGGQGNDLIYGNLGNDVVYGNLGNDSIAGGQGNDQLFGGQGNDLLSGNLGNDTMFGGLGADTFAISSSSGADIVMDFSFSAGDRLGISGQSHSASLAADGWALVTLSGGGSVELFGVALSSVTDNYFM